MKVDLIDRFNFTDRFIVFLIDLNVFIFYMSWFIRTGFWDSFFFEFFALLKGNLVLRRWRRERRN